MPTIASIADYIERSTKFFLSGRVIFDVNLSNTLDFSQVIQSTGTIIEFLKLRITNSGATEANFWLTLRIGGRIVPYTNTVLGVTSNDFFTVLPSPPVYLDTYNFFFPLRRTDRKLEIVVQTDVLNANLKAHVSIVGYNVQI